MSQIEIPDWVIEAAMLGEQKFYATKRYTSFSDIGATDAADAMRATLSAALERWLVQEAWIGRDIDGGYTRLYQQESEFEHHKGKDWFRADPLYTIRKEPAA